MLDSLNPFKPARRRAPRATTPSESPNPTPTPPTPPSPVSAPPSPLSALEACRLISQLLRFHPDSGTAEPVALPGSGPRRLYLDPRVHPRALYVSTNDGLFILRP